MTDIKEMKLKLETMKGFGSITKGDILDLITTIESQNSQIESLKAITELAVKGFKYLISFPYIAEFVDVDEIAKSTLSEIERLQNG